MLAAQKGKAAFVRTLLEHGADINAIDSVWEKAKLAKKSFAYAKCVILQFLILFRIIGVRYFLQQKRAMMRLWQIC